MHIAVGITKKKGTKVKTNAHSHISLLVNRFT